MEFPKGENMATDYSPRYLSRLNQSPRLLLLKLIHRSFPLLETVRQFERKLAKPPSRSLSVPECRITSSLEAGAEHFQAHRWAFLDSVFEPAFHRVLVENWPKRRYFTPPFDLCKAYDKGFRWVERNPAQDRWKAVMARDAVADGYPPYVDYHPHLKVLFDYLRSPAFIERVIQFSGRAARLRFNRFQLTMSYPGTYVAPHRDSQQNAASWISFIFYISGTGGENSGGTAILGDNEFEEVIFEPKNMRNTCLVFDPAASFYHGVRPMAFGKHRWMISAEYVSEI
jgi:hypothetical protein